MSPKPPDAIELAPNRGRTSVLCLWLILYIHELKRFQFLDFSVVCSFFKTGQLWSYNKFFLLSIVCAAIFGLLFEVCCTFGPLKTVAEFYTSRPSCRLNSMVGSEDETEKISNADTSFQFQPLYSISNPIWQNSMASSKHNLWKLREEWCFLLPEASFWG